ncbi:uncharacterized protein B0P05DRAFT_587668 [Gilbertella persicaria]|uniref:uncharacterized protein n=1 Tax=Gilbertella persicaria TaxID=101096 RepID=UPI00221EBC7A|nr:uncharacterized protein B0P05DRAFT_587668 [Gilbertella persicaria]KAI8078061.1 hypothetical protein B0P05DRAFT_587668 [Gilbertella persicaria]
MATNRRNPSAMSDIPPPSPSPLKPVNTASNNTSPVLSATTTTTCTSSLYHICRSVLGRLASVEGMAEYIYSETSTDPLSKLTSICRQGFPLCTLYNALNPAKPLGVESDPNLNARNSCKANVYHFIVACRQDLLFPEEDMFTISDLYQDDTNGFVKVVNTIHKLLQLLENRGIITVRSSNRNSDSNNQNMELNNNAPKNTRDKVVLELLETERKYVQDMEILQNYMRELQFKKIVSPDTIHYLFGNLNALVDFQRRFLIQLEEIAEKQPEEQRIGHLFLQMEESFCVYEPYCANYYSAQDLVVQETPRLQKLDHILNPIYELPSLLIKPVQRICKYPLLLQELVKSTDPSWPYYAEMQQSVDAIKRVTEKVNETQRQHENIQAVQELKKRLDDWRELTIDGYGNLLLQEKLFISCQATDNSERELHVFCFDKALLLCKESKGNNLLPKSNTLSINKKKRRGSLVPKFIVQTSSIADMTSRFKNNAWWLHIDLENSESDQLSIKFRNEEQLKLWVNTLTKAVKKALADAESDHLMSTQLTSPYSDDYEDEEEDDFFDEDEEDYIINRSRSNSISQQQQQMIRGKLGPVQSHDMSYKYSNTGRPYHNVPGMNLSPLPRSNNYHYYPASPPPSNPSSPTSSSSRVPSSSGWLRSDSGHAYSDMSLLDYHPDSPQHYLLTTGRSQSHSAASGNNTRPTLPINQNRLRSQSSPNIMKNNTPMPMMTISTSSTSTHQEKIPQVPMMRHHNHKPAPLDLSRPSKLEAAQMIRSVASTPRLTDIALAHAGLPPSPGTIKIKLNFNDGIYVIVANHEVTFFELMERVDKKIRLVANLKQTDLLRLKYQDEDGDFITINSNDDVQMAFESRGIHNTVNLFINL